MAGEIVVPLKLWTQRTNNANCTWDQLTQANNNHQAAGWRFRTGETAELNGCLSRPIPSDINGTPAGKIVIHWVTSSSSSNSVVWYVDCLDITYNTTSVDPASWDDELNVTDANNGAYVENSCEVSLSSTTQTAGLGIRLLITRAAGTGSDNLAADAILTGAYFVADQ